jgi:hypothetical protein
MPEKRKLRTKDITGVQDATTAAGMIGSRPGADNVGGKNAGAQDIGCVAIVTQVASGRLNRSLGWCSEKRCKGNM